MHKNRYGRTLLKAGSDTNVLKMTLLLAAIAAPVVASAQDQCANVAGEEYTCAYEIEANPIEKVPGFIKFQSRISQAKLPVGDVVFNTIYVNLKSNTQTLCTEEFNNVPVRDSVLNLEIGHTMTCALDMKIAESNAIQLQVCIGSTENCLKPVEFSSVPFAIKASYAREAKSADKANEAVQCHYAHLITADKDLFQNQSIGTGYYDFHTPTAEQVANLINDWDSAQSVPFSSADMRAMNHGGYIQWNQVDPAYGSNLHICSKIVGDADHAPGRLHSLMFHADVTSAFGQLRVWGESSYNADADQGTVDEYRGFVSETGSTLKGHTYMDHDVTMGPSRPITPHAPDTNRHLARIHHNSSFQGDATFENDVTVGTEVTRDDPNLIVNNRSAFRNDIYMGLTAPSHDIAGEGLRGASGTGSFVEIDDLLIVDGAARFFNNVFLGSLNPEEYNQNSATINDELIVNGDTMFNGRVTTRVFFTPGDMYSIYDYDGGPVTRNTSVGPGSSLWYWKMEPDEGAHTRLNWPYLFNGDMSGENVGVDVMVSGDGDIQVHLFWEVSFIGDDVTHTIVYDDGYYMDSPVVSSGETTLLSFEFPLHNVTTTQAAYVDFSLEYHRLSSASSTSISVYGVDMRYQTPSMREERLNRVY